ncbi:alkaline phosphatase D (APaseD) [Microscilla marina ATCC 23134]|uniref:Alkaline phosphatase D (APaseD) n=2 Tax=Microscilla marina TaxID=1027 RepID=A1ZYK6_MICM2|nr:alkaline phosphatase D (APaseD) [Microscilla marina ATCC 23134]
MRAFSKNKQKLYYPIFTKNNYILRFFMKKLILILCLMAASIATGYTQSPLPDGVISLPDNMYPGQAPFYYGVASGDPLSDRVIIWTHVMPANLSVTQQTVTWQVATDPNFTQLVRSGTAQTTAARDWTVKVDVTGLAPYHNYYYRFIAADGRTSVTGKTRTAPAANQSLNNLRFAVVSCTNLFSGYFNGYRRIGHRTDIDAVIHLGDYIYNKPDDFRAPVPAPTKPETLAEWRARHQLYLLDPDLRWAKQNHPFIIVWDNHDLFSTGKTSPDNIGDAIRAFREWVPVRDVPGKADIIYRKLNYGTLLDIVMIDIKTKRDYPEDVANPEKRTTLGQEQRAWLEEQLVNSTTKWRIIGNQKLFGTLAVGDDFEWFNNKGWDAYPAERRSIMRTLKKRTKGNNMIVTGDAHVSIANDLPIDHTAPIWSDKRKSQAVEFLPTSLTSDNGDEKGVAVAALRAAEVILRTINPHIKYVDLQKHGYGILDVRPDRSVAEFWYVNKDKVTDNEKFAKGLKVKSGKDKWQDNDVNSPTTEIPFAQRLLKNTRTTQTLLNKQTEKLQRSQVKLFPNPNEGEFFIRLPQQFSQIKIQVYNDKAELVFKQSAQDTQRVNLKIKNLPTGKYYIKVLADGQEVVKHMLVK